MDGGTGTTSGFNLPLDTHQIDDVWIARDNGERSVVERINKHEVMGVISGSLLRTPLAPCYYVYNNTVYFVDNVQDAHFRINLIRKPVKPNWTYVIVGGNATFNPQYAIDFELHPSEENSLVLKILLLAGVAIKDFNLAQLAGQKEAATEQQQKQ